jgi:hypothetical protein
MPAVDQAPPPEAPKLSTRARGVLEWLNLVDPVDLLSIDWMRLAKVRGCGRKTIREIAIWGGPHAEHIAARMSENDQAIIKSARGRREAACQAAQVRP